MKATTYQYMGFNDTWLRIIGIPVVGFLMPLLFFGYELSSDTLDTFIPKFFKSTTYTILYWEGVRYLTIQFRKYYPHFHQTRKRLLIQIPVVLVYAALVELLLADILCYPIDLIFGLEHPSTPPMQGMAAAYMIVLLWSAIYENIYFYYQLKQTLLEKEQAKRDHVRSQLEGLRNQVNPHFLFNSLNTLMNIIAEDQRLAIRYLKKLSKVYRYILDIRRDEVIPLQDELDFIHSYVFLQKERFRGNLEVTFDIPEAVLQHKIVPLSLQILFENAIKHNVISSKKPLHIDVFVRDEKVIVQNNLQRKNQTMPSTKVGLENVRNRYRLVTDETVTVNETAEYFEVALPLIANVPQAAIA